MALPALLAGLLGAWLSAQVLRHFVSGVIEAFTGWHVPPLVVGLVLGIPTALAIAAWLWARNE